MKNILLCFMASTMLLCLPLVSYGSDGTPTTKTEINCSTPEHVILFDNNIYSDVTIELKSVENTVFNYLIDVSTDVCTSTLLITKVCKSGTIPLDDIGSDIKPNFYKDPILSTPKTPDTLGSIDSQHVGKLIGLKNNTLYYNFSLFKFAPPSME